MKFIERSLRDLGRVQMQASVVPGLDKNFESIDDLENDVVDCVLDATALVDPLPMNEEPSRRGGKMPGDDFPWLQAKCRGSSLKLLRRLLRQH